MSRTRSKGKSSGWDFGSRYKCDKYYCAGTGWFPKYLAKKERRSESFKIIKKELSICSLDG